MNVSGPSARATASRLAGGELKRQHAHADQVRAVDPLEALGDHRPDAQELVPLAAQSREEPEPYSLPASTISGMSASMYFIAAS